MLALNHLTGFGAENVAPVTGTAAPYWSLLFQGAGFPGHNAVSLNELQMFTATDATGSDLTTGKTATSNSELSSAYDAPKAIDDDPATRWGTAVGVMVGARLTVYFGSPVIVKSLSFDSVSVTNSVKVQYSADGASWTDLATISPANITGIQTFTNLQP